MKNNIAHSCPNIGKEEISALIRLIKTRQISSGTKVTELETRLESMFERPAAVVSSGTAALHLCLLAHGIKQGWKVALPTHTCPSVLYALRYIGAKPVLYDCGPLGIDVDADSFEKAVRQASAVIIIHTFGFPVSAIQFDHLSIPIIEDCAHAIGTRSGTALAGTLGHSAVFSFYTTKMLAGGESGAVSSNTENITKIRNLRTPRGANDATLRYPYMASDLCAALAVTQLQKLDSFLQKRREIATFYRANLSKLDIKFPQERPGTTSTFYRFIIQIPGNRDEFIKAGFKHQISFGHGVLKPLHRLLELDHRNFPNSESAYRSCVSLPIYPGLRITDQKRVLNFVKKHLQGQV